MGYLERGPRSIRGPILRILTPNAADNWVWTVREVGRNAKQEEKWEKTRENGYPLHIGET